MGFLISSLIIFRSISKICFGINFIPSLYFLVYYVISSSLKNPVIQVSYLEPSICLNICNLDEIEWNYCYDLWKHLDTPVHEFSNGWILPMTHLIVISILFTLFIISTIEGVWEAFGGSSLTPYQKLYKNTDTFILQRRSNRRNRARKSNNQELMPL